MSSNADRLVVILSPPRSFSSVACAMLGQHPELYGVAETHLLAAETVGEWWGMCAEAGFPMADGLLRTIAELLFGGQAEATVRRAELWLRNRPDLACADVLRLLAERVQPRTLIEKSPVLVYRVEWMQRVAANFPNVRFIHLTRHPRGHAYSVAKHIRESRKFGQTPGWLVNLGWLEEDGRTLGRDYDPQRSWYALNRNIDSFLAILPRDRWLRVRGEDLLADPDRYLREIASWLDVRTDADAIARMKHPERSPFATIGPPGAWYGNDLFFLRDPQLRSRSDEAHDLEAPLEWRRDGAGFHPEVKTLARKFGYP